MSLLARFEEIRERTLALWMPRWRQLVELYEAAHDRVRRHPIAGEVYEVVDGVFFDYGRDHGAMYAGALAFYAVLSLIPLTVLFASVFGFFLSSGTPADIDASLTDVIRQMRKVIPYLQPSLAEDLRVVVENRNKFGIAGFVALLWAASEVFRGVEFATARIFARVDDHEVPDHHKTAVRSVFKTRLLFGAVGTAVVLFFLTLRLLGTVLASVRTKLAMPQAFDFIIGDPLGEGSLLSTAVTAFAIIAGFVVLVRVFCPHSVRTRYAIFGGLLFYVFFQLAHYGYDVYLAKLTNVSAMYGSFATLIVVILWMYYCATLLLVCCHAVKVAQRRLTKGPRWPKDGKLFVIA
ncbi:MAG: YihY/virulence factor BrkB family protein [Deltaproteobacteria bacterium]|nr:YihY/virulence factor BrkB family protein [Deltaproteobacteria bacterium]